MQTKSKPLFNFIFVGSIIPKLLFKCCFRFDSCWCLETHVGVVVLLSFDFKFVIIHSATYVLMSFTRSLSHLLPI